MHCSKHFLCARNGFEDLCRARDFGLDDYLECLEDVPQHCDFALPFGNTHFCQCPLRVYIAEKLRRYVKSPPSRRGLRGAFRW